MSMATLRAIAPNKPDVDVTKSDLRNAIMKEVSSPILTRVGTSAATVEHLLLSVQTGRTRAGRVNMPCGQRRSQANLASCKVV